MSNETYTDLENEYYKEKHETLQIEVIESFVKKYSNDADLGKAVREFINFNSSIQ
jgi:hypothetical protein